MEQGNRLTPTDVYAGDTAYDGQYTIVRELGKGGMGQVFEAVTADNQRVAIKQMLGSEPVLAKRFQREAAVLLSIHHPNIVEVRRQGSFTRRRSEPSGETKSEEIHYFEMELVQGVTLDGLVHSGELLSLRKAVQFIATVAGGISHCHQNGIIHRDIKPENIIVSGGVPKLIDFGLAGTVQVGDETVISPSVTVTGMIFGTLRYMSPEQAKGAKLEDEIAAPTDVYSLGATLFFLITGMNPYPNVGDGDLLAELRLGARVLDPREHRSDLSDLVGGERLAEIVLAATRRSPKERPSAGELQEQLEKLLANKRALASRTLRGRIRKHKKLLGVSAGIVLFGCCVWLLSQADWSRLQKDPKLIFVEQVHVLKTREAQFEKVRKKLLELNPLLAEEQVRFEQAENSNVTVRFSDGAEVKILWPLRALDGLNRLFLDASDGSTQTLELSQLAGMELEVLSVNGRAVNLNDLPRMNLAELYCNGSGVTSLAPLAGFKLKVLDCGLNGELTDLSPLRDMPLEQLICNNTAVSKLDSLSGMGKTLRLLNIEFTAVSDYRPLQSCSSLQTLYCDRWPGEDFLKHQQLEIFARLRSREK